MRSPRRVLTALALLLPLLAFAAPGPTAATTAAATAVAAPAAAAPLARCGPAVPRPCVESVTRDGIPVPDDAFIALTSPGHALSFSLTDGSGSYDLGAPALSDVFVVTLDMGTWVPRVVDGKARDASVVRTRHGDGTYSVRVTAKPVTVSGQCSGSGWCPEADVPTTAHFNNLEWRALLDFRVSEYQWAEPAQRDSFYGMNYFTNIAHVSLPPEVRYYGDTNARGLYIEVANRRYRENGTLVRGEAEMRIPNSFLREVYEVPNPATLRGSGIVVGGVGSAADVRREPGGDAMLVRLSGLTFNEAVSSRLGERRVPAVKKVKIKRGLITPSTPRRVRADRVSPTKAVVKFRPSRVRGAKVRRYQVRCAPLRAAAPVREAGVRRTRVVVKRLRPGTAYTCKVRAKSKVGSSRWVVRNLPGR
jgi:hypothetical protein